MTAIGETLRRERIRRNLGLEQISRETKINIKLLEAIESGQFEKLPGGVFAKSFVRQYARALGLDEDEFTAELQQIFDPQPPPPLPEPEISVPRVVQWEGVGRSSGGSSWLPAFALVIVVMLLCSGIYAWWQKSRSRPAPRPEPPAAAAVAKAPEQPKPEPQPEQVNAEQPKAEAPIAQAQSTPVQPAMQVSTPPAQLGNGALQVAIKAEDETWVSIKLDGKQSYMGILKPRETRILGANEQVRLVIGNAGGLSIALNGKSVPPVGPKGQVRVVQLTPAGAQVLVPRKPPVSDSL